MSGIYIPELPFPRKCIRCPFARIGYCIINGDKDVSKAVENAEKDGDCPLCFVPDHGRLGDLDALFSRVEYQCYHHYHTDDSIARQHKLEFNHFLTMISNAPTIIPVDKKELEGSQ